MITSPVGGGRMRPWIACLVLGMGCELYAPVDADFNADVDVNAPTGADAGPEAQPDPDQPRGVAVADDGAGADAAVVADAGPPALFDTACTTGELCADLAPDGVCWAGHTEPDRFPHDMYGHCTFTCSVFVHTTAPNGSPITAWELDPELEQACWAIGGVCELIGTHDTVHCVPAD